MNRFELYLELTGFPVKAAASALQQLQRLDRGQFQEWRDRRRWDIVRQHYAETPWYREKVGGPLPSCWEELPLLGKTDYQAPVASLVSSRYRLKDLYVANTSGSSGHPFFYARSKAAHARVWALVKDRYARHQLDYQAKQGRFFGIPLDPKHYWFERTKDVVMNRVRFPVFDLSDARLEDFRRRFETARIRYLFGYESSLLAFARFLVARNETLKDACPTLQLCISTAEVLEESDREVMAQGFGVPVVNEYGASEAGIMAFQFPGGEMNLSVENLFFEVQKGPDGVGQLVVTDLFNDAFPILRYCIGDVAEIVPGNGGIWDRIDRLLGRTNEMILLPSGRLSPALTFYYISRSILESSGILKEFIIRQTALDRFVLEAVSDRPLDGHHAAAIQQQMDLYLEPGLRLEIVRVDEIQRPPSGKIKHFYSELDPGRVA